MDHETASDLAERWKRDWNAHDLDALLDHFTEDVVFTSPIAARVIEGSGGVIRGKAALRDYWSVALAKVPDLRFEVVGVYSGVDVVVINYRNHLGHLVNEVLLLDGDQVREGHGTYLSDDAAGTSGVS
jgi:ketosteroid isomerase-like protein